MSRKFSAVVVVLSGALCASIAAANPPGLQQAPPKPSVSLVNPWAMTVKDWSHDGIGVEMKNQATGASKTILELEGGAGRLQQQPVDVAAGGSKTFTLHPAVNICRAGPYTMKLSHKVERGEPISVTRTLPKLKCAWRTMESCDWATTATGYCGVHPGGEQPVLARGRAIEAKRSEWSNKNVVYIDSFVFVGSPCQIQTSNLVVRLTDRTGRGARPATIAFVNKELGTAQTFNVQLSGAATQQSFQISVSGTDLFYTSTHEHMLRIEVRDGGPAQPTGAVELREFDGCQPE